MKKILIIKLVISASALGFAGCAPSANNPNTTHLNTNSSANAATSANMPSNMSGKISSNDKEFMDNALQGGMEKVQLSGIAASKAQNPELIAFAQKIINDHSRANNDLRDLAKLKGISAVGGTSPEQQKEMGEMGKLSSAAFDKAYVKKMVEDYEKDVAEFQKQSESANDTNVRRFAAEMLPTLQAHLQMIKDLQEKIK